MKRLKMKLKNFLQKHKTLRNATIGSLLYLMPVITGCDTKPAEKVKNTEFETQKIEQKTSDSYNEFLQNQDSTFQAFTDSKRTDFENYTDSKKTDFENYTDSKRTDFENYLKKDSTDFKNFVDTQNKEFEDFKQEKTDTKTVDEEAKTVDEVYKVKKGDHLWSIAKQYGKETDKDIVSFINELQDYTNLDLKNDVKVVNSEGKLVKGEDGLVDLIYVGEKLKIKTEYKPEVKDEDPVITDGTSTTKSDSIVVEEEVELIVPKHTVYNPDTSIVESTISVDTDTVYISKNTSKTDMASLVDTNEVNTQLDSLIQSFDVTEDSTATVTEIDSVKADQDSITQNTDVDSSYLDSPSDDPADDPVIKALDKVESELDSLENVMDKEIAVIDSISAELDSLYETQDSITTGVQDSSKVDLEKAIKEVEQKADLKSTDYIVKEDDHLWKIAKEQGKQETNKEIVDYIKEVQDINKDLTLDKDVIVVNEKGELVKGQDGLIDLIYVGDTLNLKSVDTKSLESDSSKTNTIKINDLEIFVDDSVAFYQTKIDSVHNWTQSKMKEYTDLRKTYNSLNKNEEMLKKDFEAYNKKFLKNFSKEKKKKEAYLNVKSQREELEHDLEQLDLTIVKAMDKKDSFVKQLSDYKIKKETTSTHAIKENETLWSIAKQYGRETRKEVVDFINELQDLNTFPASDDVYIIDDNGDFVKGQDGLTDLIYVGKTLNLSQDIMAGYEK